VKNFPKTDQIEKFNQRQKPAKWAQPLAACLKLGGSVDFSGPCAICTKSFTTAAFPVNLFASFYHLGTSCYSCLGWPNRCYDRIPDGILFFNPYVVQNSGINSPSSDVSAF
jgi:hypothetical protein